MKKLIILPIVIFLGFFSSCDIIKEDEVFINKNIDTNSTIDVSSNYSQRIAYVEYFTGHQCGNCPTKGADILKAVSDSYGSKIVFLSIHTGFFARFNATSSKYFYDFKSTTGDGIESVYKVAQQGTPQGMVNRKLNTTTRAFSPSNWAEEVDKVSKEIVPLKIDFLRSSITESKIDIEYKISVAENQEGITSFAYLAEDSIVQWQKDYTLTDQDVANYVHHNVLRAEFGQQANLNITTANPQTFSFSSSNKSTYNSKRLYAYILVSKNEEVIQVKRVKL